jgi:hypothetical protein
MRFPGQARDDNMTEPDLVLMPEVEARAALRGRAIRVSVLAPVGTWLGVGRLRVLRALERPAALAFRQAQDETEQPLVELVCGYESYERTV